MTEMKFCKCCFQAICQNSVQVWVECNDEHRLLMAGPESTYHGTLRFISSDRQIPLEDLVLYYIEVDGNNAAVCDDVVMKAYERQLFKEWDVGLSDNVDPILVCTAHGNHFFVGFRTMTMLDGRDVAQASFPGVKFVSVVRRRSDRYCAACCSTVSKDRSFRKLQVCSGCASVHYCSSACQKSNWKFHKPLCLAIKAASTVSASASSSASASIP